MCSRKQNFNSQGLFSKKVRPISLQIWVTSQSANPDLELGILLTEASPDNKACTKKPFRIYKEKRCGG